MTTIEEYRRAVDDDFARAVAILNLAGAPPLHAKPMRFVFGGEPFPKGRPRFGRGGRTYTRDEDVQAEANTAAILASIVKAPYDENVGLVGIFYRSTRRRVDGDNLIKHVLDAGNGVLWHDDSQCTVHAGIVELDREYPRTVLAVCEISSTMTRGKKAVA